MTVLLRPKGDPSPGTMWHQRTAILVSVDKEDAAAWYGRPVTNPACPSLKWPRFAWQEA